MLPKPSENTGENNGSGITRRNAIAGLISSVLLYACNNQDDKKPRDHKKAEESSDVANGILINGEKINISAIKKLVNPKKEVLRIKEYPVSDEAREIIEELDPNEQEGGLAEIYKSSSGEDIILRKTVVELYRIAQKYAEMEGYGLAIFSAWRSPEHQKEMYKNASKKERGKKVADEKDSQHVRGGAIDVLLYKKINGKIIFLTPDKKHPKRGTAEDISRLHKYLQLAGFVNYARESWHNEVGSEEWSAIMRKAGIIKEDKIYSPINLKN